MAQEPVVISGGVYVLGYSARIKLTIAYFGVPVDTAAPTVTLVRDSDLKALDFTIGDWVNATPTQLNESRFKGSMLLLGQGTYYYDFDPTVYGITEEDIYTVIYRSETTPYIATAQDAFLMTPAPAGRYSQGFGFVKRYMNVCLNVPVKIGFKAVSGCSNIKINIYDPYNNLLIAGATMTELEHTGIYFFDFLGRIDGDYLLIGEDGCSGASDAIMLNVGGQCERLKRIENLLVSMNINPPTVNSCVNPCRPCT